ncbi:hypothetical protein TanjilG_16828 [Lupinus angustifolius]|uniref:Kinesin motor domain-containing protein n=1 Tax=Lupinus angustifolius TaxID=3871 RepID=A0A394D5U1_LUPAN|nr:hypothetical protein TanjilG_16828 [Lupinus angustifolius]
MERIHVTVRARPLSLEDAKTSPWRISSNSISIPNHSSKFEFDKIFSENCKTAEVYEARTKIIVSAAVRGFNGTVFAYGQTNSGKTHTMRGSKSEPGIIPRAVHDLFQIIQQDVDREFLLRMSYMEIYNEEINDLLAPEHRKLQIHESPEIIESRDRSEDEGNDNSIDAVRVSVLNLVDLAGSERAAKTGAEGVRLKEGSHINKSLMTLGTVIKKLSEDAENQGGHVPYRDSKLTRILQPALGGNANTAIICNITLAQIHADETKSSLQFASRALRVTNCAQVNEILTDAALLKRQKKEIEELRAKLMVDLGSHSEHSAEEILNLRNSLLQIELERERIALELEEEKKTQAEWEKRVKEQAKKIENLSSMVLFSNRDETREHIKKYGKFSMWYTGQIIEPDNYVKPCMQPNSWKSKILDKRRDTWCPGNVLREQLRDVYSNIQPNASTIKPTRHKREDIGPLLPFEELVNEDDFVDQSLKQEDDNKGDANESCKLPDPRALFHVTNRKKVPLRKKSLSMEEFLELQEEYENLLLKFETQRTTNEIQIEALRKKLLEANSLPSTEADFSNYANDVNLNGDKTVSFRDSEAILVIKRLQEQIKVLEIEKISSQQNLDDVVDLATEQNICAREKFEELYEDLINAQDAARVANEQLTSSETDGNFEFLVNVSTEVQEIMSEVQNSKEDVQSVILIVDDAVKSFSALCEMFCDFKASISQDAAEQNLILSNHQKLNSCLLQKISELQNEKILLDGQVDDLQKQLQEAKLDAQNSKNSLMECSEQKEIENSELISYIQTLEKDISSLTSSSLAKEREVLRKDLEKTKTKLKETESKLKIAIQERTKLEGEKAYAEREIKRLHGQNSLLERDINKRDSVAGRRRDSIVERSSKVFDPKIPKGPSLQETLQEEYQKLEVFAFELETRITSLEEELAAALKEKEEAISINEGLTSELDDLTEKLNTSTSELYNLKEDISALRQILEDSDLVQEKLKSSIKVLEEEKEELSMQLTDSLLAIEEERAISSAKEKASIVAIEEQLVTKNVQITSLSTELSENLKNELSIVTKERDKLMTQLEDQQKHVMEVELLQKHCHNELSKAKVEVDELSRKISCTETKMHADGVANSKDMAKLKMRLRGTQARLDAFRGRTEEAINELDLMNRKYVAASAKLKERLASQGIEILNLKKQLAAVKEK